MGKVLGIKAKAGGRTVRKPVKAEGSVLGAYAKAAQRRAMFVATLAETCNVSAAARAAGVVASTCYRWRAQDAAFSAAWDDALAIGYDRLEAALLDYALEKIERGASAEAVEADAFKGTLATAVAERNVSLAELQFAAGMLARHRAALEAKAAGKRARKAKDMPSAAETDAVLKRALDGLARQVKPA